MKKLAIVALALFMSGLALAGNITVKNKKESYVIYGVTPQTTIEELKAMVEAKQAEAGGTVIPAAKMTLGAKGKDYSEGTLESNGIALSSTLSAGMAK